MKRIRITRPAKEDLYAAFAWWRQNRSAEQAQCWYFRIFDAIESLNSNPERCGFAAENDLLEADVRQLLFRVGRRPTHRIVFTISEEVVIVLRLRHVAQSNLELEDISEGD